MTTSISKYRTLIADDEQPARDRLKKLLAEHADQIELVGEAKNGQLNAIRYSANKKH
ncbi:MAG: hypothetical protein Q8S01_07185 [Ignavibacteria bacterium]|nr:hypothetical protein [Ignavibacteria bacterium]